MLKKYKNAILEAIKANNFDPENFSTKESTATFVITYLDTPLNFFFNKDEKNYHHFAFNFATYSPKYQRVKSDSTGPFLECLTLFIDWLNSEVREYLNEQSTPDLWKQLEDQKALLDYTRQDDDKATHFTDEQKRLIRLGLDEVLLLIKKEFQPTADEIGVIQNRLDYISEALDRLNKFDWKGVLIQTILGITIALSLDTSQGKALLHMFTHALSKAFTLLLK